MAAVKFAWSALVFCVCLVWQHAAEAKVRRALLSVGSIQMGRGEQIRAFHIETWGVEILAICRVPPSWELKAEKYEDPAGDLSGRIDTHGEPLSALSNMYLVDIYNYQPLAKNGQPASFAGRVEIGTVAPFGGGSRHRRSLKAGDFRLRDARRCPEPPLAQP